MRIEGQLMPPTNWRVQHDWAKQTYWESLREDYARKADEGKLSDTERIECERILATEGMVSLRTNEQGQLTYETTLNDKDLASDVAQAIIKHDQQVIWCLESQAQTRLKQIQDKFGEFKDQLAVSHPGLAAKKFGFVINELGNLEATSTEEKLSDQEKQQLNGWLNGFDDLKEMILGHADYIVTLCKIDTGMRQKNGVGLLKTHSDLTQYSEIFTLKDIGKFIDYGLLLHNPGSKPGTGYCWREQLEANGDKMLKDMTGAGTEAEAEAENAPVD